jgi:hypothetical protein
MMVFAPVAPVNVRSLPRLILPVVAMSWALKSNFASSQMIDPSVAALKLRVLLPAVPSPREKAFWAVPYSSPVIPRAII